MKVKLLSVILLAHQTVYYSPTKQYTTTPVSAFLHYQGD